MVLHKTMEGFTVAWDPDPSGTITRWRPYYREQGTTAWSSNLVSGTQASFDVGQGCAGRTYEVTVCALSTIYMSVCTPDIEVTLRKYSANSKAF